MARAGEKPVATTTTAAATVATTATTTTPTTAPAAEAKKQEVKAAEPKKAEAAAAAAATTTTANKQEKEVVVPPFKSTEEFKKLLGAQRVVGSYTFGKNIAVVVDSYMFIWIVMDRFASSANALGEQFLYDMRDAFDKVDELVKLKQGRIAIVTSAKDSFCVGADIEQLYPVTDKALALRASSEGQKFFQRIEDTKYPVVAAINGMALGGGCELGLACHHRVIASDKGQMGLPETLLGLLPGAGGTVRLPRLIGLQGALGWILKGSANRADKCKKAGAVDAVIPGGDRWAGENRFIEGARAWAGKLVDKPLKPAKARPKSWMNWALEDTFLGRKIVIDQTLKMLNKNTKGKFLGHYRAFECIMNSTKSGYNQAAYDYEARKFAELMVTPEAKNQIALYFLDNGMKAVEKKTGLKKSQIPDSKQVGVIGAGVMGSGIVHLFANKGYETRVKDITSEAVEKGIGLVRADFEDAAKKKKLSKQDVEDKMAKVKGGTDDKIFANCDLIVEAAVEIMDIKKKIVRAMEENGTLNGKNIFATNTSSLSVTELQGVSKFPAKVVGMHFFNPVQKMPLVEVVVGDKTSKETAAVIFNLALKTGKKPIIVKDAPGFLVNRVLGVYMAEAGRLVLSDRADPRTVDKVMLDFGMPMGPFRLLDEVGLDVACHVGPVLEKGLKSKRFAVSPKINDMVKDGVLGKKNKKGFYVYDEKGKEQGFDTTLAMKYLGSGSAALNENFSKDDIRDRCVLLMVNEACMILDEGVAASPEDVDIGMVWGTGFAPFRGGLLQHADHYGIQRIVDRLNHFKSQTKDDRFEPCAYLKKMAAEKRRFFPDRPDVPYVERVGFPSVQVS